MRGTARIGVTAPRRSDLTRPSPSMEIQASASGRQDGAVLPLRLKEYFHGVRNILNGGFWALDSKSGCSSVVSRYMFARDTFDRLDRSAMT